MSDSPQKTPQQIGPIAAMVVIVVLFALGGAYFFKMEKERLDTQRAAAAAWQE